MIDLGVVRPGSTVRIPFSSFDKDDGSAVTMTNYAAADLLVYKDGGTTERASTNGFTATTDFDGKTGKHLAVIDLSENTTAGFYSAGSEYLVAVDSVTIDGVTTGGWIARFVIGYPDAQLNTTIATLASQTSFTLTAGPAEDDALNGLSVIIHDVASAVQVGRAIILDYTGSTKTVTLAAGTTFTAATTDNVSVMGPAPLQPTVIARTLDVSAGGEAGVDWANVGSPTTVVGLSGTSVKTATDVETDTQDIQSRLPAALVSGRIDASVGAMAANVLTATAIAADAITDAKVAADVTIASVTGAVGSVTGAVGSVTGAVGSVTGAVGSVTGNVGGNVTGSVGSLAAQAKADVNAEVDSALDTAIPGTPTAGSINDVIKDLDARLPGAGTLSVLTAAAVNAEVVDALATDTYAEPGQGAPAATTTLAAKVNYLYKAWRNKSTQTATDYVLYADDASTTDQKASVTDDATTFTRGEVGTGA